MRVISVLNLRFTVIMTLYSGAVFLAYRDEILGPVLTPLTPGTTGILVMLLHGIGIDVVRHGTILVHSGGFAARIVYGCTGVLPVIMFIGCVVAYSRRWPDIVAGMVFGVPLLWMINMLRLVSLFYLGVYHPQMFALAHEVVWQGILAMTFIALWLSWICWSEKRVTQLQHRRERKGQVLNCESGGSV